MSDKTRNSSDKPFDHNQKASNDIRPEIAELIADATQFATEFEHGVEDFLNSQPDAAKAKAAALEWMQQHRDLQAQFKERLAISLADIDSDLSEAFDWLGAELDKSDLRPQVKQWIAWYFDTEGIE